MIRKIVIKRNDNTQRHLTVVFGLIAFNSIKMELPISWREVMPQQHE